MPAADTIGCNRIGAGEFMARDMLSTLGATPMRLMVAAGAILTAATYFEPFRSGIAGTPQALAAQVTGVSLIVSGLVMDVWIYLRGSIRTEFTLPQGDSEEMEKIWAELKETRIIVEGYASERAKVVLSEEDVEEVKKKAIEGLSAEAIERITVTIRGEIESNSPPPEHTMSTLHSAMISSQRRLMEEIYSLGRRANVNLTIGFAVSLIGMLALAFFIYTANGEMDRNLDLMQVAVGFVVKLSLVIFMQIFAYFFLRLYRYSLFEIKYFQNELTNIEQKSLALHVALESKNADAIKAISSELAKAERNFILKKGDTTVGLQREEIEARYEMMVATRAEALIDKVGSAIKNKTN